MELGIPYTLLGPDGTTIVFGNSDTAKADPNYVGWIDPEAGIAGLDSPDMVERAQDIVGGDGGIHFDFFHRRRPIVINGVLDPNVAIGTIIAREQKIKRATNAMVADAIMSWTNTGYPKRRLLLRRQQPPRITGRRPKVWQAPMVDADFRIVSDALNASAATAIGAAVVCANAGDVIATPRIEITAPGGNAKAALSIFDDTTGLEIRFKAAYTLAAGHTLVVDLAPPYPVVTDNGVDVYKQIDFLNTTWWGMIPGNNSIRAVGTGAGGTFLVKWRDAWI